MTTKPAKPVTPAHPQTLKELVALTAANAGLEADSARLSWLLHKCVYAANPEMSFKLRWGLSNHGRNAIDAAMSAAQQPGRAEGVT